MGTTIPAMPYLEFVSEQPDGEDALIGQTWSKPEHWSYWEHSDAAEGQLMSFRRR